MAVIHHAERTVSFKIVYCGTPLGGKTTNLQHVHQCLDPGTRGDLVSMATSKDRTIFFDFLAVEAVVLNGYRTRFHLYTVPGQIIYNATFQLVLRQADGVVFVADSAMDRQRDNIQSWQNFEANLRLNGQNIEHLPVILQYNKRDVPNAAPVEYMEYLLNNGPQRFTSFEAAASRGQNVLTTLNAVSHQVLARFASRVHEFDGPSRVVTENSPAPQMAEAV
jgi:signal recognition particle receptor subunit beta